MKISFTKKEYQILLNMLYVGDWVLHAHTEGEMDETKPYKEFEQKILALAHEFGMENFVQCNEKTGQTFLSKDFTTNNEIMEYIDKFENATF